MREKAKKGLPPLSELFSLENKKALITGAAAGIGEAIAHRFAEAGANLELVDLDEGKLAEVKEDLKPFTVNIGIHRVNLADEHEIDALWKKLEGKEPDVLVNNAGIYPGKPFLDVDAKFLKNVMDVNCNSVFWMCQHMIRSRLKKGGVIVNMGSMEAAMPLKEGMVHYDISKAGVMVLSRALASEYGKHGFRINVLVPGGTWTSGTKNMAKDALRLKSNYLMLGIEYKMRTPLGRMGKPDEIARMALVLASDVSSYVNGALVVVDGGFLSA